jgi:hypothetical protein
MADLAAFEYQVALALGFALDRRGVLSRFDLADALEEGAEASEEPVSSMVDLLACSLRTRLEPPRRRFEVIPGGKDSDD